MSPERGTIYDLSTVGVTWDPFIMRQADSKQPQYT